MPPAVRICEKMRQPRWRYLKPASDIAIPNAIPIDTRPSSPIQRLSKAYFRKKAVANRISSTAIQPIQRRPIIDSRSNALSVDAGYRAGGGSGTIGGDSGAIGGGVVTGSSGAGSGRGSRIGSATIGGPARA